MKAIHYKLLLACLAIFTGLWSCTDDEDGLEYTSPSGFTLYDPGVSTITINTNEPDIHSVVFSWNDLDNLGAPYTVEMASMEDFSDAYMLGTSQMHSLTLTMDEMNMAMNDAGFPLNSSSPLYFRVGSNGSYTNVVNFAVISYPTTPPVLTAPSSGTAVVLDNTMPDATVATVEWTDDTVSGTAAMVMYTVEADVVGNNFASPVGAGTVTDMYSISWTHSQLNGVALGLGLDPDVAGNIELRIKAVMPTTGGDVTRYSDPITLTVTPYTTFYGNWFLVGNATAPGWDPNNNNNPLFINYDTPTQYTYTGYFAAGSFKLLGVLGQWQPQWGNDGSGSNLGYNPGGGNDPGTIDVATSGYYTFTVNRTGEGTGTYTLTSYDDSSAATYPTMEIIGAAQGDWTTGTSMTQSSFDSHIWYAQDVSMTTGEFKFRTDSTWTHNWGVLITSLFGQTIKGNQNNMTLDTAGTYDVWFNDLTGHYILILQ